MQFAKDKRLGIELSAESAARWRRYVCPACGEDVYLRRGAIRVDHFAHVSGRADPACENYRPASAIGNPLAPQARSNGGFAEDRGLRIEPLKLGLRVESATRVMRGGDRRWRLVLTLPKSVSDEGTIHVGTGFADQGKKLSLFTLSQGPRDIDVSPNAARFGADWVSDKVDGDFSDIVSPGIDGFAPNYAQAFAANAAAIKPLATSFVWGDGYYILWKRADFSIPNMLSAQSLAPYEGWAAAFITLCTAPCEEIADWVRRFFTLPIRISKRQWGVVFPPPVEVDVDGNISVWDAERVVLAFAGDVGAGVAGSMLSIAAEMACYEVETGAASEQFVHVQRHDSHARAPLRLEWGSDYLPSIVARHVSITTAGLPAVFLRIRDPKLDREWTVSYHRPEAHPALDRVRQGDYELVSISVPQGVVGSLEQRGNADMWEEALPLETDQETRRGGGGLLSPMHLGAITRLLVDRDVDVRLSFGIFGQYTGFAQPGHAIGPSKLSWDTRRRIIWYCRAVGVTHIGRRHSLELARDDELLVLLGKTAPRRHLIAHKNLLTKKLKFERIELTAP